MFQFTDFLSKKHSDSKLSHATNNRFVEGHKRLPIFVDLSNSEGDLTPLQEPVIRPRGKMMEFPAGEFYASDDTATFNMVMMSPKDTWLSFW
jgi:hypothetical protein